MHVGIHECFTAFYFLYPQQILKYKNFALNVLLFWCSAKRKVRCICVNFALFSTLLECLGSLKVLHCSHHKTSTAFIKWQKTPKILAQHYYSSQSLFDSLCFKSVLSQVCFLFLIFRM